MPLYCDNKLQIITKTLHPLRLCGLYCEGIIKNVYRKTSIYNLEQRINCFLPRKRVKRGKFGS